MRLLADEARPFVSGDRADSFGPGSGLSVEFVPAPDGLGWRIALVNDGPLDARVRACGLVVPLETHGPVRLFSNGYQSWSPTGLRTLGIDRDPSQAEDSFELFCAAHHADQRPAVGDELRSEMVMVLADERPEIVLVGWLGGELHDGTFRVRTGSSGVELVIEAFLGGVVVPAGSRRQLHSVSIAVGSAGQHGELLDRWATDLGRASTARAAAPFQVGWCSWYHYFADIDERALDSNLELGSHWPFEVFQLDDGYQTHIGDWLGTNGSFSSDLPSIAARIRAAGRRPGIWLAPFLAHPGSNVHRRHPEWIARMPNDPDAPVPGMINDIWDGVVNVLDTSNPEVLEHLESVAAELVGAGFTYLKLDFTYAPSFDGRYADSTLTPAQRVRAGYDAIRRGAGEETFILGCGAPLGACVGAVDGMRIGPDVAPSWEIPEHHWHPSGYRSTAPATRNAWQSTLARSFMHRRLWLNDPDCVMLRTEATDMTPDAVHAWALAVAASGGMVLVSDDLALLDDSARALLDEVIAVGREVDAASTRGAAPTCPDLLLDVPLATMLAGPYRLSGDPTVGIAELRRHGDLRMPGPAPR